MNAWYHARSSARKWGGPPETYLAVHEFIDHSKSAFPDMRHRAMLHNSWGIYLVGQVFGPTLTVPRDHGEVKVPTRLIAEQHVLEDLGRIPTVEDYLKEMTLRPWMGGGRRVRAMISMNEFLGTKEPA